MTTDNRRAELSHVRAMVSAMQAQCDKLRESWPDRYPVPVEVDAAYSLEADVIDKARSGDGMLSFLLDLTIKRQQ